MEGRARFASKSNTSPSASAIRPDPGTVEGHLNAVEDAAETRRYNKRMKELEIQDEAKRRGLLSRIMRLFCPSSH